MNDIKHFYFSVPFRILVILLCITPDISYSQAIITLTSDSVYKAIFFQKTSDSTRIYLTNFNQFTIPNLLIKSISNCEATLFLNDSSNINGSISLVDNTNITLDSYRCMHTYKKSDIIKIELIEEEKPCGVGAFGLALSRTAFAALFYRYTSPENPGFMIYGGLVPGRSNGSDAGGLGADLIIDFTRSNFGDVGLYLGAGITNNHYTTNAFFSTGLTLRVSFINLKFGYVFEDKPTTDWNDSEYPDIFIGFGFRI